MWSANLVIGTPTAAPEPAHLVRALGALISQLPLPFVCYDLVLPPRVYGELAFAC
ncbi:hypothetical protein [Massilia sp. NR 4-1]|uniref:hypothetical protein n=1 Tax=Massilia sp. NR 4-1 TaxID=1678028 RepID=UPI001680B74D|nr:hypothetical protein [Massilia sp. NR 4-1]